jgi:hypothetical protein
MSHRSSAALHAALGSDVYPCHEIRWLIDSRRFARAGPIAERWTSRVDERSPRQGERPQRCRSGRRGSAERRKTSGRRPLGGSREVRSEHAAPREEAICGLEFPGQHASLVSPNTSFAVAAYDSRAEPHPSPRSFRVRRIRTPACKSTPLIGYGMRTVTVIAGASNFSSTARAMRSPSASTSLCSWFAATSSTTSKMRL